MSLRAFSFPRWIKQSAAVGAGIGAANIVPNLAAPYTGTSAMAKIGVQTATAVVGGMVIAKFGKSKEMGVLFAAGVGGVIVWDLLSTYVLKGMFGLSDYHLSGYALADEYFPGGTSIPAGGFMSAYPDTYSEDSMSAFPDTVLQY
jgi:hypothetical protein